MYTEFARDALEASISQFQGGVIANIKRQWELNTFVDFINLHDTCDSIQDRAILVLMQLQQRTITLSPVDALPLEPFSTVGRLSSAPLRAIHASHQNVSYVAVSSSNTPANANSFPVGRLSSVRPITPPSTLNTTQCSPHPDAARRFNDAVSNDRRDAAQYKPMATTVTTTGLFGIGKRMKVEPIVNRPENPLVEKYLAVAIEDAKQGTSGKPSDSTRTDSTDTSISSICEPDHSASETRQYHQSSSSNHFQGPTGPIIPSDTVRQAPLHRFTGALNSYDSQRCISAEFRSSNKSINYIDRKHLLPSEMNMYAGFCKGAWRQQIGDKKRAVEERLRPGGIYNSAKYYQCKQCKFEGRLIPMDEKTSGFDMRVFKLVQGIQFRWEFMFKSHVRVKEACLDPTKATFGCIFCCAEGMGTPKFGGIQTFMNHLLVHREHLPTGEVLYRMNCLVGRQAASAEDFDINIELGKQ